MAQPSKAMATGPETSHSTKMRTDRSGRIYLRIGNHLITRPVSAMPPRCSAGRSLAPRNQHVSNSLSLKGETSQPQCVEDDRNRAEAHRRARDDRIEQEAEKRVEHARGDRHAERVVDKGEEKILADIAHGGLAQPARPHDPSQVALHQCDTGALHRHVCAGAHCDRSEEHTSELQSHVNLVCRLLLEKKKKTSSATPSASIKDRQRESEYW